MISIRFLISAILIATILIMSVGIGAANEVTLTLEGITADALPNNAMDVCVTGNHAYVADYTNGLVIVDISDPAHPTTVGNFPSRIGNFGYTAAAISVAVSGNYAYVANWYDDLYIIDVTDKTNPTLANTYTIDDGADSITISGNLAFIAAEWAGVDIIDISDPVNPVFIGNYNTDDLAEDVAIQNNYAYIADRDDGVIIVDVSDLANPSFVGSCDTPYDANSIVVSGAYAYVADADDTLIIDISNPAAPAIVGQYDTGDAWGIALDGNYVYVGDGDNGVVVLNVNDPANPVYAGSYDTAGYAGGLNIVSNLVYVADGLLVILRTDASGTSGPVHNINKGTHYTTIQDAIDDASPGDEIHVDAGTYVENVIVDKQLALIGEGADMVIVQAADSQDHVIEVTADWVNLSGFTVTGTQYSWKAGIYLNHSNYSYISDNNASNNDCGILIGHSFNNNLQRNIYFDNWVGISLQSSSYNILKNNNASRSDYFGIHLEHSPSNTILNNLAFFNVYGGISVGESSSENNLTGNTANLNDGDGIYIWRSNNCILMNNNASSNGKIGIILEDANISTLSNNIVENNYGGIYLNDSIDNLIYHNNIKYNTNQANDDTAANSWDSGYPSGGNYWSDYIGNDDNKGLNQDQLGSDGIGDTPYPIPGGSSVDRYPLMVPWDAAPTTGPVHNINKGTDYTTIQAAIDDASPGDEIHVDSGTYYENVVVNKQLTLIGMNIGFGLPVVDAGGSSSAITLNADGIILEGFKTINSGNNWYSDAGIKVTSNNNRITANIATENVVGIRLYLSNDNILIDNDASYNSDPTTVNSFGIFLTSSNNNTLTGNTASNNIASGIYLTSSLNNSLYRNIVNNNYGGISFYQSNNNTINENIANNNSQNGMVISESMYNTLTSNIASNNSIRGIYLLGSNNNILIGNTANNNSIFGIALHLSSYNKLSHNNLVYNSQNNALDTTGNNQWDSGTEGNYYSDYPGTDSNGDGIGDTPYPIPGGSSVDNYPLMATYTPPTSDHEGKLLRQTGDFKVYLVEDGKKRHFTSPEALEWNGHSFDDVIEVSVDVINSFEPSADISITQAIIDKYNALGGVATFGPPAGTGEQSGYPDSAGVICTYVNFQNGAIEYFTNGDQAGNAYAILNPFFDKWASMGYAKSVLGYPISDMSDTQTSSLGTPFKYQNFINGTESGSLEYNLTSGEVFEIHGAIYATWSAMGYADSILGLVTSDEREAVPSFKGTTGRVSDFENGHLHWHRSGDHAGTTYMTYGDLDALYVSMGGTDSWLGFPVMHQEKRDGYGYCEFEGGYIEWDGSEYKALPITDPVRNINKGTDYTTIQAAIDDASPGDEIHVDAGIYIENVDVNKQLTLIGKGMDEVTVVAADTSDHVFEVTADYVNISGFMVTGTTGFYKAGFYLDNSFDSIISHNNASNNNCGIYFSYSSNTTLQNNIVLNNEFGIELWQSNNVILRNNRASNNNYGINLWNLDNNTLLSNTASDNRFGVGFSHSSNNTLQNNIISGNTYNFRIFGDSLADYTQQIDKTNMVDGKPIYYWMDQQDKQIPEDAGFIGVVNSTNILVKDLNLVNSGQGILFAYTKNSRIENVDVSNSWNCIDMHSSDNNTLHSNTASNNQFNIVLWYSNNNTLESNNASNNRFGFQLRDSNNNILVINNASNNWYGIYLNSSNDNTLYHNNLIDNIMNNAYDDSHNNAWDNGYPSGGNYLSDYSGVDIKKGLNQDQLGSDGIGDTPYPITDGSNVDRYPLMAPYSPPVSDYEGKLLRQTGDFKVYLIEDDKKRHFTSPEALEWNGYSFDDVIEVSVDVINSFESGADISITQVIIDKYNALGGAATFGPPAGTGEQTGYPDNAGVICTYVNFQNGAIEYFTNGDQAGNAYAILNPFFNKWASLGYGNSVLGYPISDMSDVQTSSLETPFKYQNFMNGIERGALEYNLDSGEVFEIHGAIYATWGAIGYAKSVLGAVTSDELPAGISPPPHETTGKYSKFENGTIHWISYDNSGHPQNNKAFITYGDLDEFYTGLTGTNHWLGFPVMNQTEVNGHGYCEFEGGYIEWDAASGEYLAKTFITMPPRQKVQAFYYSWYGDPSNNGDWIHWNQNNHQPPNDIGADFYPILGPYSSKSADIVDQHMKWLQESGVGVVVVSWWGKTDVNNWNSYIDQSVPLILDKANAYGLKVAWHIEPYDEPYLKRTANTVKDDIIYIYNTYGSHPAFFRDSENGNQAVFYIFESSGGYGAIPEADWAIMLDSIRGTEYDSIVMAQTTDTSIVSEGHFDGFYTYALHYTTSDWVDLASWADANGKLFAPSVGPGYIDDRAGGMAPNLDRQNGVTYDEMWQAAISSSSHRVSITSFNEWHEGSQIEPADLNKISSDGYDYIDYRPNLDNFYLMKTRYWTDQFLGISDGLSPSIEIAIPTSGSTVLTKDVSFIITDNVAVNASTLQVKINGVDSLTFDLVDHCTSSALSKVSCSFIETGIVDGTNTLTIDVRDASGTSAATASTIFTYSPLEIKGLIKYTEKSDMSIQPLKYVKIELDDDLDSQNGILGSTNTRYDGNFNIQIQDKLDLDQLYIKVYADSIGSIVDKVRVNDVDSSETYYYTTSISKSSFNWIDFSDGKSNDVFNIYSNILKNYNYYLSNGVDSNKIIISLNKFGGVGDYIPKNDYLQEPHILLKYSEYPVRIDVINHEYGHFVMDYYNVLKNNPVTYLYLFDWNKIPEIDNILLINYLKQNFGITWLESSEIKKIDNGNTIFVSTEKNHLSLKLNDEKDKINLEIDDGRTYEFGVKMIDGGLIAFDKKDQNIIPKNNIAWIEGWATFASGTINDEDTLYYYEGLIISLENAKICPISKPYCINGRFDESQDNWGRNAAFLWDVYDGKGGWDITEKYDKFDGGNDIRTMLDILMDNTKIYKTDYDGTPYYHMVPLSVKEFYQYWVDNNKPQKKELDGLIKHHFKEYKEIRGFSPINIHLYNSNGDHIGLNKATGDIDREIVGSYYSGPDSHPEEIFLITGNEDENIKIIIRGTNDGTFTLTYENAFKEITSLATYENIPVNLNSIAYITDNMNFGNNIMRMDFDGDGIIDELILPTSILISGENLYNITFLPPITTMNQYNLKDGSTLPIKFTARNSTTDEFIYDDTVNVTITNSTGHLITYFTHGKGTDSVRINSEEEQYIVNFHSKDYDLNVGDTYAITVTFGEPDSLRGYEITYFTLVDKGKGKEK